MVDCTSMSYVIRNGPVYYLGPPSNWGRLHQAHVFDTEHEAELTLQRLREYSPGANHDYESIEELPSEHRPEM